MTYKRTVPHSDWADTAVTQIISMVLNIALLVGILAIKGWEWGILVMPIGLLLALTAVRMYYFGKVEGESK